MNWLRRLTVRRKLMLMIVVSCGTALCLAGAAFVGYDLIMYRRTLIREITVLADVLGNNSTAALSFNARDTAEEMLNALRTQPHIVTACLYDKNGRVFATYARPHAAANIPAQAEDRGYRFAANRLTVFRPIWLGNKPVGTIYLESDLTELTERLHLYVIVVSIKVLLVLLVVIGLSVKLQDVISRPILALTTTAKAVSEHRNYAVRAQKTTEDELGTLTDAFNGMLAQIQRRDMALQRAHDELEARVAERTAELSKANAALQVEVGERQCAEAGLRIKTDELARSNTELEQFAYIASHDLQEPLRMVSSYLQLLEQRYAGQLDATANEFIHFAVDGALRMRTTRADIQSSAEELPAPAAAPAPPAKSPEETRPARQVFSAASPGMELDLRGQRAEDALLALERYLEQAYSAGMLYVRIIHGKGTGKLRQVVREALTHSPQVSRWENGMDNEGGEGVTVAHLAK